MAGAVRFPQAICFLPEENARFLFAFIAVRFYCFDFLDFFSFPHGYQNVLGWQFNRAAYRRWTRKSFFNIKKKPTLLIPYRKFEPPYLGKATTAARAALPSRTSAG